MIYFVIKDELTHFYKLTPDIKIKEVENGFIFYKKIDKFEKNLIKIIAEAIYSVQGYYIIINDEKIDIKLSRYLFYNNGEDCYDAIFFEQIKKEEIDYGF